MADFQRSAAELGLLTPTLAWPAAAGRRAPCGCFSDLRHLCQRSIFLTKDLSEERAVRVSRTPWREKHTRCNSAGHSEDHRRQVAGALPLGTPPGRDKSHPGGPDSGITHNIAATALVAAGFGHYVYPFVDGQEIRRPRV